MEYNHHKSFTHLQGNDLAVAESLKRLYETGLIELAIGTVIKLDEGHAEKDDEDEWEIDVYRTSFYIENAIDPLNQDVIFRQDDEPAVIPYNFFNGIQSYHKGNII